MSDIRIVEGGRDFVRKRPSIFVRSMPPCPVELASALAQEALLLGASAVEVLRCDPWWVVRADRDWLAGEGEEDRFDKIQSYPEAGPNSARYEVVVAAFAQIVLVADIVDGVQTVVGDPGDYSEIPYENLATEKWPKAIAFSLAEAGTNRESGTSKKGDSLGSP